MSDQNVGIGDRIAAARKHAGLSQVDFAPRAHVSLSLLRKVEQGQRAATPAMVAACAAALNIEVAQLTGQPYDQEGRQRDPVHALLPELRRALAYWDLPPHLDAPARSWDDLATATQQVAAMRRAGQHTDRSALGVLGRGGKRSWDHGVHPLQPCGDEVRADPDRSLHMG